MPLTDAYQLACEVMALNMTEQDASEGVAASIENREPRLTS